jgi:hypothetical protein
VFASGTSGSIAATALLAILTTGKRNAKHKARETRGLLNGLLKLQAIFTGLRKSRYGRAASTGSVFGPSTLPARPWLVSIGAFSSELMTGKPETIQMDDKWASSTVDRLKDAVGDVHALACGGCGLRKWGHGLFCFSVFTQFSSSDLQLVTAAESTTLLVGSKFARSLIASFKGSLLYLIRFDTYFAFRPNLR